MSRARREGTVSRTLSVAVSVAVSCCVWTAPAYPWQDSKPNIVFILADDLGYGDVKCFGQQRCQIATPNFDRLAREGVRFTDAHVNCSHCVPTRMAIMTGRYPWRFGPPEPGGPWGYLGMRFPPSQHTLGSMVHESGYRSAYIGKWHLGTKMVTRDGKLQGPDNVDYQQPLKVGPVQFRFDYSFILPGSLDMFPYAFVRNNHWVGDVTARKGWSAFHRVGPAAADFEDVKVLDTFCREAEGFIAKSKSTDQPFFLFLALTSPHTPLSPSVAFDGKSRLGVYGDFVMETDHCIGRVLRALEQAGVAKDTLVIATSDHGAASYAGRRRKATAAQIRELEKQGHFSSGIYRGYKFSIYEGGVRVPLVARWPNQIQAGGTCDRLVAAHDLMATVAELSGAKLQQHHAPDSVSFASLLKNPGGPATRDTMVYESVRAMAIRQGPWKLALCPGSGAPGKWGNEPGADEAWKTARAAFGRAPKNDQDLARAPFVQLFHLGRDPAETTNLADDQPQRVRELVSLLQQQIDRGRTTDGPTLKHGRQVPLFRPPAFVWK